MKDLPELGSLEQETFPRRLWYELPGAKLNWWVRVSCESLETAQLLTQVMRDQPQVARVRTDDAKPGTVDLLIRPSGGELAVRDAVRLVHEALDEHQVVGEIVADPMRDRIKFSMLFPGEAASQPSE